MKIENRGQPQLPPNPLQEAADGMEANFMKELLRTMRTTVGESEEDKNNKGLQIFRGMLDDEYAEKTVKSKGGQGIGLSDLIVRQVQEMYQAQQRQAAQVRPVNQNDFLKK